MRKSIVILSSFLLIFSSVKGQGFDSGGLIIDPSTITAFDMFETSQTQFGFGTARSAAMAGAMTSLGGDASSLSINPAGLGMYRSNEISITPYMSFSKSTTNAAAFEGDKKNRFSIGGLSFIAKIRESSTGVMAINMGLAYTRLADYNYKYSFATTGGAANASIADVFAGQLAASGMTSSGLKENYDAGGYFRWDAIDPTYWGAVLGYKTGLVGDNGGIWQRDMIAANANVDGYTTVESRGSAGEWTWSLGINFNSKFYLGASLGLVQVNREREVYYGEGYRYSSEPALNYRMDYFNYDQISRLKGTGVNFKIGAIYRPIESLRIGVAFHTPTLYNMTYQYSGVMTSQVKAINNVDEYKINSQGYIDPPFSERTVTLVDDGDYSWRYTTPSRLLVGVSYTIAKKVVVSVDYQRDWYQGMRVKGSPYGKGLYQDYIKDTFQGSNTLRAGIEWRVIPQVALRLGYGFWNGALKDDNTIFSTPVVCKTDYMSTGVGVALTPNISLDFAYSYSKNTLTPYKLFYGYNSAVDYASPTFESTIARHNAMITLGFHF